jgi:aspartyl-tRNA(Asn)/glutamyl-tRNA(Gln) amidotransferase subunit A
MLEAIAGHDPNDSTSVPEPVPAFTDIPDNGLSGVTVGIPTEYSQAEGLDPQVKAAIDGAVKIIEGLGARCIEVSLPHTDHAVAAYYVIAPCEASSNLARYDGVKYGFRDKTQDDLLQMYRSTRSKGFGPEVQRRIILGTYALSAGYYDAYYGKASQIRTLIRRDFEQAFATCDAILSPVAPTPAYPIGATLDDPLAMYLSDVFTLSANLAGIPGISVPCGFSDDGMPIGLQIMGRHFNETMLFTIAGQFERAVGIRDRKPPL